MSGVRRLVLLQTAVLAVPARSGPLAWNRPSRSNWLTRRLRELEEAGLVQRQVIPAPPGADGASHPGE